MLTAATIVCAEPTSTSDAAQQAPPPALPQKAAPQVVRQTDAVQLQQHEQSDDRLEQQMAAVLSAAAAHLQQAQAATNYSSNQDQQQQVLRSLLRSEMDTAQDNGPAAAATGSSSDTAPPPSQEAAQQLPQQVAFVLKLGPVLSTAVKQTQLVRVMSAVLLAYAVLSGWEVGMPPALLVPLLDVLIVVSTVVVLGSTSYGQRLAAAEAASKDVQVPKRLRSFDVLSLFPGLRELISVFTGYRQFANALSEDVAVYIVGLGLFTVMVNTVTV